MDLDEAAYRGSGAVVDRLRDRAFTASGIGAFEADWFVHGTVEWTSGANAGRRAEVIAHDVTEGLVTITLLEAPLRGVAEGDGFEIRAGCDKHVATCASKFANVANFRGFPRIPGQDTVIRYATSDGGHEGDVL